MRDHLVRVTDHRVAAVLAAAAAPAEAPVPGEAAALAAFRLVSGSPVQLPRRHMKTRTSAARLAVVTALSALSLVGGGYAVAATNTLPGSAAQAAFEAVGVSVHGKSGQAHGAAGAHGRSAEAKARAAARRSAEVSVAGEHGAAVSTFARETELTGREKGQAIAAIASANRQDDAASRRQDGVAPEGTRKDGKHSSPTRETAGDQGATSSSTGRSTAATNSAGASGAGAGNADTVRP